MPSSIKKDFDYSITNLDWGDGTDLEFTDNPKLFDRLESLQHTYEKPGFYTIRGLVYKKALQLVNIYPPVEEDSSIHYQQIEIENTDEQHDANPIPIKALQSFADEESYLASVGLNYNVSGSEVKLNPSARGGYLINETFRSGTQIEIVDLETNAFSSFDPQFDKAIIARVLPLNSGGGRTKNAGVRFNFGLELDTNKNNFFAAEFDAWLPDFGRLDDSGDPTQYVLEIRLFPEDEESTDHRELYYFSGTNEWQTIRGEFFNSTEYYKSMYVEFRQLDRNLDAPNETDGWAFYIKNIQMKIQNTNNIKFPLQWERFRSNIVVNSSIDYDSPFFDQNNFVMIGGLSKDSYYYKSLASVIGYDFNNHVKKENFSFDKYNPYDVIFALDTLAKFDSNLYDEYLDPYTVTISSEGNIINNGIVNREWHGTFEDTGLTDTDVSSVRIRSGVRPMWRQLGFSSDEFDRPDQNFYWKNIIPSDFDLSNREGITQRDLPDPMKGSLTPRIPRKEFIVDEEATQYWNDGYYWPALPKFNKYGGFSDEFPPDYENQTYGSENALITSLETNDPNINFDLIFDEDEVLDQTDSNDVTLNVDFTLSLDANDRMVKKSEDFSDTIETDSLRQAF